MIRISLNDITAEKCDAIFQSLCEKYTLDGFNRRFKQTLLNLAKSAPIKQGSIFAYVKSEDEVPFYILAADFIKRHCANN